MQNIHVQPVVELVRCYEDGSYADKSSYVTTLTLIYESDSVVTISGLCGTFNKKFYLLLREYLFNKGIKIVKIERRGKLSSRMITRPQERKTNGTRS